MRSLIIIEVEHDTTDPLNEVVAGMDNGFGDFRGLPITDYTVKVDLPSCFTLDTTPTD